MKIWTVLPILLATLAVAQNSPPTHCSAEVAPPSVMDKNFQDAVVNMHNTVRKGHCAQPLRWDDALARQAQADVDTCTERMQHMRAGSNLMGFGPLPMDWIDTGIISVRGWYSEIEHYNWEHPGFTEATGHFTQVVWRDSAKLGCAFSACGNVTAFPGRLYCYYDPIGNWINAGAFEQNVWPPNSCPT